MLKKGQPYGSDSSPLQITIKESDRENLASLPRKSQAVMSQFCRISGGTAQSKNKPNWKTCPPRYKSDQLYSCNEASQINFPWKSEIVFLTRPSKQVSHIPYPRFGHIKGVTIHGQVDDLWNLSQIRDLRIKIRVICKDLCQQELIPALLSLQK